MARGPFAARGASTVVPAASSLAANAKQKIITTAQTGLQRIFFTSKDLQDPERLYQVLAKMRDFFTQALQPLRQCPLLSGQLLTGQVFQASVPTPVYHGLGRPYVGYIPVLDNGNAPAFSVAALPTGLTASQAISLQTPNAGTYALWIF